jgi:hypothetical protein
MRLLGAGSPGYDSEHPPHAVFDWDNTSIANDTEEALSHFQIETFSFRRSVCRRRSRGAIDAIGFWQATQSAWQLNARENRPLAVIDEPTYYEPFCRIPLLG